MTSRTSTLESPLAYQHIKSRLAANLRRQWAPGSRLPPIRKLARQLRAGERNTFRAVRELVAEGALVSAPRRGTYVAATKRIYMPLGQCDGMKVTMANAFEEELRRRGHTVTRGPRMKPQDLCKLDAEAVVLIHDGRAAEAELRPDQVLSVVSISGETPAGMKDRYDAVSVDQSGAAALAGAFLREAGVADACFIGTGHRERGEYFSLDARRLRGFEEGLGQTLPAERRLFCRRYGDTSGAEAIASYLAVSPRPRAVFTVCDDIAIGFLLGALAHGLQAGRDFDLIGFDGQWRGQELMSGPLTTVAAPPEQMGRLGAELLASRLETPDLAPRTVLVGCRVLPGVTVRMSSSNS